MNNIIIKSLHVYPIKSCRGLERSRCLVDPLGLDHDRRMVIVNSKGEFMAQRIGKGRRGIPEMCLLKLTIGMDYFHLEIPKIDLLQVPFSHQGGEEIKVDIWGDTVQAVEVSTNISEKITQFLSKYIQDTYKLVWVPVNKGRPSRSKTIGSKIAAHDQEPFLVVSEESLNDLNQKILETGGTIVPMDRFRPNIVLSGGGAYWEDTVETISIGTVTLHRVGSCVRCAIPGIIQYSGERDKEPLSTLAIHRKNPEGKGVIFGSYFRHEGMGVIEPGNKLIIK